MGQQHDGYETIIKAVHGRWRRRFLFLAHIVICFAMMIQVAFVNTGTGSFINDQGLEQPTTYTWNTYFIETPMGQLWLAFLAAHFLYAVIAELRDRAVRKEIERERKWRVLESLEWAQPDVRARVVRLAESRDGELIDFDSAAWEANTTNGKHKRG
jgi:hypothetical protein